MTEIVDSTSPSDVTELSRKTTRSVLQDLGAPIFVWGVWALMLLLALLYVKTYAANVPLSDDFEYVDVRTGAQSFSLSWLWSPHAGFHREPVPKLILVGLYYLIGDVRAAIFLDVLAMGALGFAMIWTAKGQRGWISYSDAIFPLALLHLGHSRNFLWSWQVAFFCPVVLASTLLLVIVKTNGELKLGSAILAGLCLILLPLCGAVGVALVPPLVLWLGYIAARYQRSEESDGKRKSLLILSLLLVALLLTGLYVRGLPSSSILVPVAYAGTIGGRILGSRNWATLQSALYFLPQAFGPPYLAPLERWLTSVAAHRVMSMGLAGSLLLTVVTLVRISRHRSQERPRTVGLLLFLVAMSFLSLAVGYGRPGAAGLTSRYAILAVPALCCVYFTSVLYGPPVIGFFLRISLVCYSLIMLIPNAVDGIEYAHYHKQMLSSFEKDLHARLPIFILSSRYSPFIVRTPANSGWIPDPHNLLTITSTQVMHQKLEGLRRAGIGDFRLLQKDPAFSEIDLPLMSATLHQMTWDQGGVSSTGADPYLIFNLPKTKLVGGIRFKYSHPALRNAVEDTTPEPFLVSWKREEQDDFTEAQSHVTMSKSGLRELGVSFCAAPQEETVMVWVGAKLKQLRIRPDDDLIARPRVFRISEVVLLLPTQQQSGRPAEDDRWAGESFKVLRRPAEFSGGDRRVLEVFLKDVFSGVYVN